MKKLFFVLFPLFSCLAGYSQGIAVNNNGAVSDPSAILDISSTTKGVLIPRMSGVDRSMIIAPAEGLMVFDTDSRSFWFYSNGWNEILPGNGFTLPYDGVDADPNKLFSITNNSASPTSVAVYGRIFAGSGLMLSQSNGVWGDNANGNGVAGTSDTNSGVAGFSNSGAGVSAISTSGPAIDAFSTTGFGISSISQTNFGIASASNAADKAGVLGVNTNNSGIGYGVIGSIENPTGGAGVYGKNASIAGNAGLFNNTNTNNIDPALKATTSGNGAAGYFAANGLGPSGYFVHNNVNNQNPGVIVSNSSSGPGLAVWNSAANSNHGLWVAHNGSGKAILSTSETGQAGVFNILDDANDFASLEATTVGTGLAGKFVKNNTSEENNHEVDPAVLIDNNSNGNALKILSFHPTNLNSGIQVNYIGESYGTKITSNKGGISTHTTDPEGVSLIASNYAGGYGIKAYNDASSRGAVHAENYNMFGYGVNAIVTGSEAVAIKGTSIDGNAGVWGINEGESGAGVIGKTTAFLGHGVRGETSPDSWGIPGHFTSYCEDAITNTLLVRDYSKGQTVRIQVDNELNDNEAIYARTYGTGKLASFNNFNDEVFSVGNTGNVMVNGTLTVKGNKGIVRNSTGTQMRMETVTSPVVASGGLAIGGSVTVNVTFATAFSSPPVVTVANISTGFTGPCDALNTAIKDVTTTGCTLRVFNTYMANTGTFSGTWKLVAVGAE